MAKLTQAKKHELLRSVLAGRLDLEELCEAQRISLEQLADWAAQTATLSLLQSLRHLADLRTQLMISRFRAHAAARLIELTGGTESAETARKACVDLLRMNVTEGERNEAPTDGEAGESRALSVDTERVRLFLADLGRTDDPATTRERKCEDESAKTQATK